MNRTNLLIIIAGLCILQACNTKSKKNGSAGALRVAEAKTYVTAANNEGHEITIRGFVWGVRDVPGGGKMVAIGDEILSGVKTTPFLCRFDQENEVSVSALKRDQRVVITGLTNNGKYGAMITECTLISMSEE